MKQTVSWYRNPPLHRDRNIFSGKGLALHVTVEGHLHNPFNVQGRTTVHHSSASVLKMFPALVLAGLMAVSLTACGTPVPGKAEIKVENKTNRIAQLMRIANTTRKGGDLISASNLYRRAALMSPKDPAPMLAIGETEYALKNYRQSSKAYFRAVELSPDHLGGRLGYGRALIAMDQPDKAAEQFTAAINIAPKDYRTYNGLGVAHDLMGDHAQRVPAEIVDR